MPKYVIERHIPGCGNFSAEDLRGVAQKSNEVLNALGPRIQWVHSYVTGDTIYCVYISPNEEMIREQEMIREHATRGGFPANRISEVRNIFDPTTAEKKAEAVAKG
jgi:hypothetical protein